MKIGYVRVSTEEQNTARQEIMLRELGVDELFIEKASGKNADRVCGGGRARTRVHFAASARGYCHRQTAGKVPRPSAEGISGLRTHRSAVAEGRNHRRAGDEAARDEQDKILRASEAA